MLKQAEPIYLQLRELMDKSEDSIIKFANYRDMCRQLGLEIQSSNSKQSQLKFLSEFCDMKKIEGSNQILITKLYEVTDELEKFDSNKQVNINNLTPNSTVTNYKEMCQLLDEKVSTGKSRQLQLERWSHYFNYEKEGHKFIIHEIYETPLPFETFQRKPRTGKYITYIEPIILHLLFKQNGDFYYSTKTNLLRDLGMVNENYKNLGLREIEKIIPNIYITNNYINNFYNLVDLRLLQIVGSALKSLAKRHVIIYTQEKVATIKIKGFIKELPLTTPDLEEKLHEIENLALQNLNYSTIEEVRKNMKWQKFYELCNIYAKQYGWNNIYSRYKISLNPECPIDFSILTKEYLLKMKQQLNETICDTTQHYLTTRFIQQEEKAIEQVKKYNDREKQLSVENYQPKTLGELKDKKLVFTYHQEFKDLCFHLIDVFIRLKKLDNQ